MQGERKCYLGEALQGDYGYRSEDRLSQIFSASFNHSPLFRKLVATFFQWKNLGRCTSKAQYICPGYQNARIDVMIRDEAGARIAVENKVDAALEEDQLRKYCKIGEIGKCRKYVFVKRCNIVVDVNLGWKICYWGDFFLHLNAHRSGLDQITSDFLSILEEYGLNQPSIITDAELKAVARFFYEVRKRHKNTHFVCSEPVFETLNSLEKYFTTLMRRASENPDLQKWLGKSVRPRFRVSYWWDTDKPNERLLWLGCDTSLKRHRNGFKSLGAGLLLFSEREKYAPAVFLSDANEEWEELQSRYRKNDLRCDVFSDNAMSFWAKKLQ